MDERWHEAIPASCLRRRPNHGIFCALPNSATDSITDARSSECVLSSPVVESELVEQEAGFGRLTSGEFGKFAKSIFGVLARRSSTRATVLDPEAQK